MRLKSLTFLIALFLLLPTTALADGIMFMDEAGNIHFASSVSQVPAKYKPQVVKPVEVNMSPKEFEAMQKKKAKEAAKEKKLNEKKKAKEEKLKARENKQKKKRNKKNKKRLKKAGAGASIEDVE